MVLNSTYDILLGGCLRGCCGLPAPRSHSDPLLSKSPKAKSTVGPNNTFQPPHEGHELALWHLGRKCSQPELAASHLEDSDCIFAKLRRRFNEGSCSFHARDQKVNKPSQILISGVTGPHSGSCIHGLSSHASVHLRRLFLQYDIYEIYVCGPSFQHAKPSTAGRGHPMGAPGSFCLEISWACRAQRLLMSRCRESTA